MQLKPKKLNINKNDIVIAFFGGISAGKTAFINTCLSEILGIKNEILHTS